MGCACFDRRAKDDVQVDLRDKDNDKGHTADVTPDDVIMTTAEWPVEVEVSTSKDGSLMAIDKMPEHLKYNVHVLTGYRPFPLSAQSCLKSALFVHNETGNIITHVLPLPAMIVFACIWGWGTALSDVASCVTVVGLLCAIFVNSVLYHMFIPHHSATAYYTWLAVDYTPIFFLMAICPPLTVVRYGLVCHPDAALYCHVGYCILCVIALGILLWKPIMESAAGTAATRLRAFALQQLGRTAIYIVRWSLGTGSSDAMQLYMAMEVLSVVGGVLNALKVPERWSPGTFDYWGNSHQVMHILAAAALLCVFWGARADYEWYESATC